MMIIVPEPDDWPEQVMFVAKSTEACRAQQKIPASGSRSKAQPACSQHSNEVSAAEDEYILSNLAETPNDTVRALADFCGRLTLRGAIAEQVPVRVVMENLC